MNHIQKNIDAIERIVKNQQAVPSRMLRDLLIDCKALLTLCNQQRQEIEQLKAQPEAEQA